MFRLVHFKTIINKCLHIVNPIIVVCTLFLCVTYPWHFSLVYRYYCTFANVLDEMGAEVQFGRRHHAAHNRPPITPRDAESGDTTDYSSHTIRTFEDIHRRILETKNEKRKNQTSDVAQIQTITRFPGYSTFFFNLTILRSMSIVLKTKHFWKVAFNHGIDFLINNNVSSRRSICRCITCSHKRLTACFE